MAAFERYQAVVASLPNRDRDALKDMIQREWEELLAARSEEARVRLVDTFVAEAHDRLRLAKH
jgi:hypothetical protein